MRSSFSGISLSVDWCFVTDVSVRPVGPLFFLDCLPLKMGRTGCPETSVENYHCSLSKIPEERKSRFLFIVIMATQCCGQKFGESGSGLRAGEREHSEG
jgi:hypothetical protein